MNEKQYISGRTLIKLKTLNRIKDIVLYPKFTSFEDDRAQDVKYALISMEEELKTLKIKFHKLCGFQ